LTVMALYDLCIVGGGSIGSIMAYYGFRGGLENIVVYYGSRRSVEEVSRHGGITVSLDRDDYFVPVIPMHYTSPMGKCRFILNCVKAYQVPNTHLLTRYLMDSSTRIVYMQNGFGSCEEGYRLFGHHAACGVVFIGALRTSPSHVIHMGGNTVYLGSLWGFDEALLELSTWMNRGDGDFRVVGGIEKYRWIKLAVNAVINPLTAIARARNSSILGKWGRILAEKIITEVVEAASRKGVILDKERLLRLVLRAAENTRDNYSSMAMDILSRRRTEVDYINGYIAGILGENSINYFLTSLIHFIEESLEDGHTYNTSR